MQKFKKEERLRSCEKNHVLVFVQNTNAAHKWLMVVKNLIKIIYKSVTGMPPFD